MPEAKDDLKREKVRIVPISNIEDFPDHPFQVKDDESMDQLVESIRMNAEVARIMEVLKQTDMNFTEFDDVTVRRLVECIQVCGNQKIVVTLKGGYQAEELLKRIDAVA